MADVAKNTDVVTTKKDVKDGSDDALVDAINLMAQGKRNLVCGEVPQAVSQLQEACQLLATKHGETADECAEVYFYYGRALLELSRMESGVLGNALEGMSEDEGEKSADSADDSSEEKMTDTESEDKGETEDEVESEDIENEDGEEEEEGEDAEAKDGEGDNSAEGKAKEKEEEDVSNLQLAWEMLELAKIIFKRHESKEMKLKLAETHLKLGECGLETEQYEQAMGDFKQCLVVQKSMLEPEDRALAETYYQLGLACTYNYKYDDAVENYRNAANIIEAKLAKLTTFIEEAEKEGKGKDKADFDCPVYKARKEVDDLKEILPDMIAKIEDVKEEKKNAEQVKQLVKDSVTKEMGEVFSAINSGESSSASAIKDDTPATKASDISHLVRKKRKPENEDEEETAKKQKTEKSKSTSEDKAESTSEEKAESTSEEKAESTSEEKAENTSEEKAAAEEKPSVNSSEVNGVVEANGHTNGKPSPEKTEIKTKTVEDVKKQTEQMDTSEASS